MAVIGRPNVGKSSLINVLLAQKIAAVSAKPQTTRRRQLGILSSPDVQIVFVDTPGLHVPQHKLGDYMNQEAVESLKDADLILWLLDASVPFTREDNLIADRLNALRQRAQVLMMLTKIDLMDEDASKSAKSNRWNSFRQMTLSVFSNGKEGIDAFLPQITFMPVGESFFDDETVTDYFERDIAAELIRESVLSFIRDEVPHCVAVRVDGYEERGDEGAYIEATIFVERDSQKGIIIGKGGEMIKKIGTQARKEIETMSGRKVFLSLHTKVNKNWRNDSDALQLMGYAVSKERDNVHLALFCGGGVRLPGLGMHLERLESSVVHCQTCHPDVSHPVDGAGERLARRNVVVRHGIVPFIARGYCPDAQCALLYGGIGSFLLAHSAYLIGFNQASSTIQLGIFMVAVTVGLVASVVLRLIRPGIMRLPTANAF